MIVQDIVHVLLVEDNPACVDSIRKMLEESPDRFSLETVNTLEEVFNKQPRDLDIIIMDMQLPNGGLESFLKWNKRYLEIPIITLTLASEEHTAQQTMEQGAESYLIKDDLDGKMLTRSIKNAIIRNQTLKSRISDDVQPVGSRYFNVKLLKEYEQGLSEIIDFLPDAMFVIDRMGRVIAWNRAIEEMTEVEAAEILGKGNYAYALPFYGKRRPVLVDLALKYDEEIEKQYNYVTKENDVFIAEGPVTIKGELRTLWIKAVPLYDKQYNNITVAITSVRDITEQKRAQYEIEKALEEKDILLKEIHHRVKNNLQIVSSLLSLQEGYLKKDSPSVNVLRESKNRISSMAMIHEMLYQSGEMTAVNFSSYIERLITNLFHSYHSKNILKPRIDAEDVHLNIETAIPVGLIINELVSNSLKYAFPGEKTGHVTVKLRTNSPEYELSIGDDGVGFPPELDYKNIKSSLGLKLVNALVEQLDGTIEMDKGSGTRFIIKFRELKYTSRI